ncbi:MAG: helix-turn-helix domain-containing protein [Lachnospiraceae bacterium]|nr:helix-turn-helix domain-containing protein [Lachnospiraceae bacterium]
MDNEMYDIEERERIERAKRFSKIWWRSRADAGVSQEYVAIGVGVSRKTVQNWEKGISSPDLFQASEWFNVLGLNPLPYFLDFIFPQDVDGIKGNDEDKRIDEALKQLIEQLPAAGKRQLLYMLYGNHGSSPNAVLNLMNAHLQAPLKDRIVHAAMIVENYELEKMLGNLVCPSNIQPDIKMLRTSMENARTTVEKHRSGYHMIQSEI